MLTLISPAKALDFDNPSITAKTSTPVFGQQTRELVSIMRDKSASDLRKMMSISPKLAELNVERYKSFKLRPSNATAGLKQAVLAFHGDVYMGLEATSFTERDFTYAQKHLRILSGLYGLLRPLDMIQPYRLEMGSKLKNPKGSSLLDFWGDQITQRLNTELKDHQNKTLVNLTSKEYFKSVQPDLLPGNLITPVFKDYSNGTYKVLMFYAKNARGAMAAWIVKNRINKPEDLKAFDLDDYGYNEAYSNEFTWVFTRKS